MWEEEYYIFDSQVISEKEFDEKVEYEDYQAFSDSMTGEEVTDRLNKYNKEYLDCHNDVLRLEKENEQLKQFKFNTFKLIDKNIKKYQNHLEDVEDDAVCPERYIWEIKGHLQALTELKEALNE